jgi:uncharacterized protein (TIGR00255 family)
LTWMSMTGFGRGESHGDDISVTADIRSVNHRYLDVHVKAPGKFVSWESRIRAVARETLRRGKVDIFVNVREWGSGGATLRVNRPLLAAYMAEAESIGKEFGISTEISFGELVRIPELFVPDAEGEDDPSESRWLFAEKALRKALEMLQQSRAAEGENLRQVIREALGVLAGYVAQISALTSENKQLAASRFRERINAACGEFGTSIDPGRLHQEIALQLDRLDITEEIDRLKSHLSSLSILVEKGGEALGKRFDFLVQEVFRELTTSANKSAHPLISATAVTAKTELEKIREQIQNVE